MKSVIFKSLLLITLFFIMQACTVTHSLQTNFPAPEDVFITTGDGDIQKPYTPVGQMLYFKSAGRLPLPLLGMIPLNDIDVDIELKTAIYGEIRRMGGDALINMNISWTPANNGLLGFGATGGSVFVSGTVIKR